MPHSKTNSRLLAKPQLSACNTQRDIKTYLFLAPPNPEILPMWFQNDRHKCLIRMVVFLYLSKHYIKNRPLKTPIYLLPFVYHF